MPLEKQKKKSNDFQKADISKEIKYTKILIQSSLANQQLTKEERAACKFTLQTLYINDGAYDTKELQSEEDIAHLGEILVYTELNPSIKEYVNETLLKPLVKSKKILEDLAD